MPCRLHVLRLRLRPAVPPDLLKHEAPMKHRIILAAIWVAVSAPAIAQTTRNVPAQYPTIQGCALKNNLPTGGAGGSGLGFYGQSSATSFPIVSNCVIASNYPAAGGLASQGGGMWFYGAFNATFLGCVIANNSTSNVGG